LHWGRATLQAAPQTPTMRLMFNQEKHRCTADTFKWVDVQEIVAAKYASKVRNFK